MVVPKGREGRLIIGAVRSEFLQRQDEGKKSSHFFPFPAPPTPQPHLHPCRCQSPQRPPPPTAHGSLAAAAALRPTTVLDHE